MWGEWRLTLRKAEHALSEGQLDRACRYVTDPAVQSFRQARDLAGRVVEALARRAREQIQQGECERAWNDLMLAEKLDGSHREVGEVRRELMKRAIDEASGYLKSGQPEPAIECLERLARRGVGSEEARRLKEAAVAWRAAREQARAGRFAQAGEQFAAARGLLPDCEPLEAAVQEAWAGRERLDELEPQLHRALAAEDWTTVLAAADEILGLAPEHAQARAARRGAWNAVGAPVSVGPRGGRAVANHFADNEHAIKTVMRQPADPSVVAEDAAEENPPESSGAGERFLLWIDGIGGYLVCLGDRVSIGQPAGWHVDIPIMADLSRLHAWIERDGEGYVLRAVRPATVNGHSVKDKAVLKDAAEITLGHGVHLNFHQPTALSRTALVRLTSPHRLSVAVDAVLLMAETCIIGGISGAHILAPGWPRQIVLFRQGDELWCRTDGGFEVDGQPCQNRSRVTVSSRIRGDGFSLALEPAGDR